MRRWRRPPIADLLAPPLTPKQVPDNTWEAGSLLDRLKAAEPGCITLAEYIDTVRELSQLKFGFNAPSSDASTRCP